MRPKFLFILGYLLMTQPAVAQLPKPAPRPIYMKLSANVGSLYGAGISISAIIARHHEISVGSDIYFRESNNFPADYDCLSCKEGLAKEWIEGGTLTYGYVFYPRFLPGRLRCVLRGGLLIGMQDIPREFTRISNPGPHDDNYRYQYDAKFAVALVLRPTADVVLSRCRGLSLGPYGIFSKDFCGVGGSLSVLLGHVSGKPKVRKPVKERLQKKRRNSEQEG